MKPMSPASRAHKIGAFVAVAHRTLSQGAKAQAQSRYSRHRRLGSAVLAGARTTLASLSRVLHLLWLQVTGLFFLVFAAGFGAAAVRLYRAWTLQHVNGPKLALVAVFSALFAWFGVTSFWRAARDRRS